MTILDGKKLKNEILEKVRREVAKLTFTPIFCDVLVLILVYLMNSHNNIDE